MLSNVAILSLAALSAVNAGPLRPRQTVTSTSTTTSSTLSSVTASASSVASAASVSASSASAIVSSAVASSVSAANTTSSSTASSVSPSTTAVTGNQTYAAYPCPVGYLLTYVEQNVTLPIPLAQVEQTFGLWGNSSFFPNVTNSTGGSSTNATHTLSIEGVTLAEELVAYSLNASTGFATYTWNLTNGPVLFSGVSVSNYSTVLKLTDPSISINGTNGTTTFIDAYVNFCASSQAVGQALVSALTQLELGSLVAAVGANATNATAPVSSSVSSVAAGASTSASSALANATSAAASMTSSVASTSSPVTTTVVTTTSA